MKRGGSRLLPLAFLFAPLPCRTEHKADSDPATEWFLRMGKRVARHQALLDDSPPTEVIHVLTLHAPENIIFGVFIWDSTYVSLLTEFSHQHRFGFFQGFIRHETS